MPRFGWHLIHDEGTAFSHSGTPQMQYSWNRPDRQRPNFHIGEGHASVAFFSEALACLTPRLNASSLDTT